MRSLPPRLMRGGTAFQHGEETQHGGVAIEDRPDFDHCNGGDEE